MEQELETKMANIAEMVKETANFFADVQSIYDDLVKELGDKNLISKNYKGNQELGYKTNGYYYQHLQKSKKGFLVGFTIDLITYDDTLIYDPFANTLEQLKVDKKAPLIITYGCFDLIDKHVEQVKCDYFFAYCQGIMDENEANFIYKNFDKHKIAFNAEIIVENEDWTNKVDIKDLDWNTFFSKAKIKYKPLLEFKNYEDVKKLAEEIKGMEI